MNDYMEKGYAEKIPREQLEENDRSIWYLPRHPVTHPLKPDEVRVVYDVEAMFHQVLVGPEDHDAFQFLWWSNPDLSGEMEEYRMTRHLFRATSSPSVANFCLRKTAELHQEGFDSLAVETVKRNMYVDDLMKSLSDTNEAIGLVSQLRQLLEKGGFRLTKWYSNSREVLATIPESESANSVKDLELDRLPTESALAIKWNTEEDVLVWDVSDRICN